MPRFALMPAIVFCLVAMPGAEGCRSVKVGEIQGTAEQSRLVGEIVAFNGVVIGGSAEGLGGVFIQGDSDGDGATSDGVFVVLAEGVESPPRHSRVKGVGTVAELGEGSATLTALTEARFRVVGIASPPAAMVLDRPPADWEPYEGMLVTVPAALIVSGTNGLGRFGEIMAGFDGRLYAPTEIALPGEASREVARDNTRRRLILDDGDTRALTGLPWYLPVGVDAARPLRTGSLVRGVTGVVDQRRGAYRIQLTAPIDDRVEQAPRPPPPTVPGDVRVAAFNVLNLFNGDGRGSGFPTERGAETPAAYERQQQKIVAAIQALAPDVAALQEIENDGYGPESSLAQLVEALNETGPIADYRFVGAGAGPGSDAIRVALIYRASRVLPIGEAAVLEEGPFATHSRAPLAQAFRSGQGPAFTVVANHFKSKGCGRGDDAATGADADQGDGQSCWNPLRTDSARRLDAWLRTDPTRTGSDLTLLLGDFNSHSMEDPIRALKDAGWLDAFSAAAADAERPYTYVFSGESGRLDHALLSPGLSARLRGVAVWHAGSDELTLFDYADGRDLGPYRASDHDPILVGFDLGR